MVSLLLVLFGALRVACIAVGSNFPTDRQAEAFNTSFASKASLATGYPLFCFPALTERDLSLEACLAVSRQMGFRSTATKTWGDLGEGELDVTLPQRFIAPDGTCAIDVFLAPPATSALASEQEVALAGLAVIKACVRDKRPSRNGIFNLDQGLAVAVSRRFQRVDCYGSVGPSSILESCRSILPTMQRSYNERSFGTQGASIKLPYSLTSADGRCHIIVRTTGSNDRSTWRELWEAAVDLIGVCAFANKKGMQYGLGKFNHLTMSVGPAAALDSS